MARITKIPFGNGASLQVDKDSDVRIVDCGKPRASILEDPRSALEAALLEPLGFPSVAEAVIPSDRVAIAVDHDVPRSDALVAGAIRILRSVGIDRQRIAVVAPDRERAESIIDVTRDEEVEFSIHDPNDRNQLSYLAATRSGNPIYVNRHLVDADFLIPIGCTRLGGNMRYLKSAGGLYPVFSDEPTQRRFRSPGFLSSNGELKRCVEEADEAMWCLGSRFTVQVIPGTGEHVLHILAGESDQVSKRGRSLAETAWACGVPRAAELVIAAIEGGPDQHTWENVGRAVSAALRIVETDGSILVCTELATSPGQSLLKSAASASLDQAEIDLDSDPCADALTAAHIIGALRRVRLFLHSRLNREVIEDLGIVQVDNANQIKRLMDQHQSVIVLANSQHALPTVTLDAVVT